MGVETLTISIIILTFGLYFAIGYAMQVKDTRGFYVAGQGIPAIANGAATAADWMSAASFLSMAGTVAFLGYDGTIYLLGWTGGYVLLALLLAPYLRKFGKYTLPDFVGERYYSKAARALAAGVTIFISLTYIASQMRGVGIIFSRFLDLPIEWGVGIGMVVIAFFAILGGMKGITWTQVVQCAILLTAYLVPAIALSLQLTGNPIPQLGFTFSDLVPKLNRLQVELGFQEYVAPFQNKPLLDVLAITCTLMLGTAGLPHIIVRFYTVPSVRAARYSAFWALVFISLLYTTAPAIAVFAKYTILNALNGKTLTEIQSDPDLAWAISWQKTGLLGLQDKDQDGKLQLRPNSATSDIRIEQDIIVLANPEMTHLPTIVTALVAAGGLAAALSTASGLLLVITSSISHDLYYHLFNPQANEKQRLFVSRLVIFLTVLIAGYFGVNPFGFVAQMVTFTFGLAAASFFPIIFLGIFDKRTTKVGAMSGMVLGLVFTSTFILLEHFCKVSLAPYFWGISAEGIGVIGAFLNFITTFGVSRLTANPPEEVQQLVEFVRIPRNLRLVSRTPFNQKNYLLPPGYGSSTEQQRAT